MSAQLEIAPFSGADDAQHGIVRPMPPWHVAGSGRDRAFPLRQYFTDIDGLRTAFFDQGEGQTLLFIHGLAGNATHWIHVAPNFADRCRVVGLDVWGSGASAKPHMRYSVDRFVSQVRGLMDRLNIKKATLVGHSLGGMIAARFALLYPRRTENLVMLNPAGTQPMPLVIRALGHAVLREKLLASVLPIVWKGLLGNVFYNHNQFTEQFVETCEETYDVSEVLYMARLMDKLRPDLLHRNFQSLLEQLRMPTWLIWGKKDRIVPARMLRRTAKQLPNVIAEEIQRCGHMPLIERPDRINALLAQVIRGIHAV